MLKYLLILTVTLTLTLNAQDGPKKERPTLTPEQKKLQSEFIAKYDTNKDGKLNTQERSKVSVEDRKKMRDLGLGRPRGGPKPPLNKPAAPKH